MKVEILHGIDGINKKAEAYVIIDVFRAFSTAYYLFYLGVEKIILASTPDAARKIKEGTDFILVGEVGGKPFDGCDFGNSPYHVLKEGKMRWQGETVILRTSAGVQGVIRAAEYSKNVYATSFPGAKALSEHLRKMNYSDIKIVAMGENGRMPTPEDDTCAEYLKSLLLKKVFNWLDMLMIIIQADSFKKFFIQEEGFPPQDPALCLQRDIFDFVIKARKEEGQLFLYKINRNKKI